MSESTDTLRRCLPDYDFYAAVRDSAAEIDGQTVNGQQLHFSQADISAMLTAFERLDDLSSWLQAKGTALAAMTADDASFRAELEALRSLFEGSRDDFVPLGDESRYELFLAHYREHMDESGTAR